MKITFNLFALCLLFLWNCKAQKNETKPVKEEIIQTKMDKQKYLTQKINCELDENLVFSYKKGGCRGFCEQYTFYLYKDGKAIYEGERNVKNIGKHKAQVEKETLAAFVGVIDKELPISKDGNFNFTDPRVADIPVHRLNTKKNCYVFSYWKSTPKNIQETAKKIETMITELQLLKI